MKLKSYSLALDRVREAAVIGLSATMAGTVMTAALWWDAPGKVIFCITLVVGITSILATYAVLWILEQILIISAQIKKAERKGYVPTAVIKKVNKKECEKNDKRRSAICRN